MYTEFMKKKVFEQLTARRRHERQKVLIPECDLTGRKVMVNRSSSVLVSAFFINSVYTNSVLKARVHECSKNFDAIVSVPLALSFKMNVSENANTVNLKSASIVVIMLLHKGLTHIQSQIKPCLLFGESFTSTPTLPQRYELPVCIANCTAN